MRNNRTRRAITLLEVIILIVMAIVAVSLLLPNVRYSREAARRMSCSDNFRQLGIGLNNYESTFKMLPSNKGGTGTFGKDARIIEGPDRNNQDCLSGTPSMIPYIESKSIYIQIYNGYKMRSGDRGGEMAPPGGPAPWITWNGSYTPWSKNLPYYRCPSDPRKYVVREYWMTGRTNYVFCYGDTIERNGSSERKDGTRGMFQSRYQRTFKDAADGLSNTILMSEVGTDDGTVKVQGWIANDCPNPSQAGGLREVRKLVRNGLYLNASACEPWRGARWADGRPAFTAFNTVLPPNSASCIPFAKPNDWEWGIFSASSYHPGGVHVLMGDAAVRFITDAIDTGNLDARPPSYGNPEGITKSLYGAWGALGTRHGGDSVPADILE